MTRQEKGFLHAYDQYADSLFRHCYFRLYDRELAKDLVQETYCKAWDYMAKGNEVRNLRALLYRIATNLIIDHVRARKPISSIEEMSEQGHDIPTDGAEQILKTVSWQELENHLQRLDDDHRSLLHLRFIEGYKPKEIAEIIDQSPNVVSVRIHRALQQLRKIMPNNYES